LDTARFKSIKIVSKNEKMREQSEIKRKWAEARFGQLKKKALGERKYIVNQKGIGGKRKYKSQEGGLSLERGHIKTLDPRE